MTNTINMQQVMSILRPLGITRVLTIDTEYRLDENFRQHVVCVVAHENGPCGRTRRIWLDDDPKQSFQLPLRATRNAVGVLRRNAFQIGSICSL